MKLKKLKGFLSASSLFLSSLSLANEVQFVTNKPMNIVYRVAHQKIGHETILGPTQTIFVDKNTSIVVDLNGFNVAGIVPISVDGHVLPNNVNRFNQPHQCSMATDYKVTKGILKFSVGKHAARCSTEGGVVRQA